VNDQITDAVTQQAPSRRGRPTLYTWEEYKEAGAGTLPASKVAAKLGVTLQTVYKAIRMNKSGAQPMQPSKPVDNVKDIEYYKKFGIGEKTDTEVALALGVTRERVRQIRARYGIEKPSIPVDRQRWRVGLDEVISKVNEGLNVAEIARATKMSQNEVNYRIKKAGVKLQAIGPRPLFSKEQVIEAFQGVTSVHEASEKLGLKHYSHIFRYIDRYGLRGTGLIPDGRVNRRKE
jgi:hypothetical protein